MAPRAPTVTSTCSSRRRTSRERERRCRSSASRWRSTIARARTGRSRTRRSGSARMDRASWTCTGASQASRRRRRTRGRSSGRTPSRSFSRARRAPRSPPRASHSWPALHAAHHGRTYPRPLRDLERALDRLDRETWVAAARLAAELDAVEAFAAGLRLVPAGESLASELDLPAVSSRRRRLMAGDHPAGSDGLLRLMEPAPSRERLRALRDVRAAAARHAARLVVAGTPRPRGTCAGIHRPRGRCGSCSCPPPSAPYAHPAATSRAGRRCRGSWSPACGSPGPPDRGSWRRSG